MTFGCKKVRNFWTSSATISFPRKTVLHGERHNDERYRGEKEGDEELRDRNKKI
jgi:hypothetical protein